MINACPKAGLCLTLLLFNCIFSGLGELLFAVLWIPHLVAIFYWFHKCVKEVKEAQQMHTLLGHVLIIFFTSAFSTVLSYFSLPSSLMRIFLFTNLFVGLPLSVSTYGTIANSESNKLHHRLYFGLSCATLFLVAAVLGAAFIRIIASPASTSYRASLKAGNEFDLILVISLSTLVLLFTVIVSSIREAVKEGPLRLFANILALLMMPNASIFCQEKKIFLFPLICSFNVILSLVIAGERLRKDKNQAPNPPGKLGTTVVTIGIIVVVVSFIIALYTLLSEPSLVSVPMALLQLIYVIFHFAIRNQYPVLFRFCTWVAVVLVGACVLTIAGFLYFTWEINGIFVAAMYILISLTLHFNALLPYFYIQKKKNDTSAAAAAAAAASLLAPTSMNNS